VIPINLRDTYDRPGLIAGLFVGGLFRRTTVRSDLASGVQCRVSGISWMTWLISGGSALLLSNGIPAALASEIFIPSAIRIALANPFEAEAKGQFLLSVTV
jgi:hypothetical protein